MLDVTALRDRLGGMSADDLRNEVVSLYRLIGNCKDILDNRKSFGGLVRTDSLVCPDDAVELLSHCKSIACEKKERRLKMLNEVLRHGEEEK